jgi:hypothetical protein
MKRIVIFSLLLSAFACVANAQNNGAIPPGHQMLASQMSEQPAPPRPVT